jgi:hypothetical protein
MHMTSCRAGILLVAVAVAMGIARGACAQEIATAGTLTCEGPFAKDSSHAKLIASFGTANVAFQEIQGDEGLTLMASVVYPKDPRRRLEILWKDEESRRSPGAIWISGGAQWTVGRDVRIGADLAQIEATNGRPFKLRGFDTDYAGTVTDFQGGVLSRQPGGCRLSMSFAADEKAPASAYRKLGGKEFFQSNDPNMLALQPRVRQIYLTYQ